MSNAGLSGRLDTPEALRRELHLLFALDPRLAEIAARIGPFEVRLNPPGFAGMARVICGQQLSIASAGAIWSRFAALPGALEPDSYLQLSEAEVRGAGFSLGKYKTVRALAEAVLAGTLDFDALEGLSADEAIAKLTAVKGVGPWTAEIYLMFCTGHPDVFPAGDLALQKAVQHALGLDAQPTSKQLIAIARAWSPHRHAAALLFWRYYARMRHREGVPL